MTSITLNQLIRFNTCPRKLYFSGDPKRSIIENGSEYGFAADLFFRELALPFFQQLSSKGWNRLKNETISALENTPHDPVPLIYASVRRHLLDPLLHREARNITAGRLLSFAGCAWLLVRETEEFLRLSEPMKEEKALNFPGRFVKDPDEKLKAVWIPDSGSDLAVTGPAGLMLMDPEENRVQIIWIVHDSEIPSRQIARQISPHAWLAAKSMKVEPMAMVIFLKGGGRPFLRISHLELKMGWRRLEEALPGLARLVSVMKDKGGKPPDPPFVFPGKPCRECGFERFCINLD